MLGKVTSSFPRRAPPLTKNGVEMLFKRVRERARTTCRRISPHILRHTFAVRYLVLGNDPFSLQELLGHEDMTTIGPYMHMNDTTIQRQKRKYSPRCRGKSTPTTPASNRNCEGRDLAVKPAMAARLFFFRKRTG